MARKFTVEGRISAVDAATPTVKRAEGSFRQFANYLRSRFVITAGEAARAMRAAFAQIEQAATLATQTEALKRNLATQGVSFDEYIAKLREVSKEQVSTAALIQSSSKALLLGIPADQIAELLEIAGASAAATGQSVRQAFEDITTGIGRASPLILDNLGIVLKLGPAYEDMARALGKNADELTAVEQKQAILKEVLRVGRQRVKDFGDAQSEATKKILEGQAALEDYKITAGTLGSGVLLGLVAVLARVASGFQFVSSYAVLTVSTLAKLFSWLPVIGDGLDNIGAAGTRMSVDIQKAAEKTYDLANRMSKAADVTLAGALGLDKTAASAVGAARDINAAADAAGRLGDNAGTASDKVVELGNALGVMTSVEVSREIDAINKGLEVARERLRSNSPEYIRLERIASTKIAALRAELVRLESGLGGVEEATDGASTALDQYGEKVAGAATGSRGLRDAIAGTSEAIRSQTGLVITLASQYETLARSIGYAEATAAALRGGATLSLGGTRLKFPGGGSRLTHPAGGFPNTLSRTGTFTVIRPYPETSPSGRVTRYE